MKIGVSLNDFYYWNKLHSVENQLKYFNLVKKLDIDAIELHISEKEILNGNWKKFIGKLGKCIVTVHLPKDMKKSTLKKLKEIQEKLKVRNFILHADKKAKFGKMPKELNILIENCDKRKKGFQNLRDLKKFKEDICLDIDHLEESFPGELKEQIKHIKGRIKEIHISALNNKLYDYPHKTPSRHYLVVGSNYKMPKFLSKKALWIIEGVVPKGDLTLLKKEIKMLRKL
jgi:hypothetical protein